RALVRVHFVKPAVDQTHSDVDHVIAGEIPTLHRIVNTLFGWLDELARNCPTLDLVLKNKTFAGCGFDLQLHVCVLTAATGLFLEYLLAGRRLRYRLAISDLRLADVGF